MAVPAAALARTSTVTTANPTPPTNVEVQYQGSPPTLPGLVPLGPTLEPDISAANFFLCKDPLNGAVKTGASAPTELAGKAEADGSETKVDYPSGRLTARCTFAVQSPFTETPNASHPSYGT